MKCWFLLGNTFFKGILAVKPFSRISQIQLNDSIAKDGGKDPIMTIQKESLKNLKGIFGHKLFSKCDQRPNLNYLYLITYYLLRIYVW